MIQKFKPGLSFGHLNKTKGGLTQRATLNFLSPMSIKLQEFIYYMNPCNKMNPFLMDSAEFNWS